MNQVADQGRAGEVGDDARLSAYYRWVANRSWEGGIEPVVCARVVIRGLEDGGFCVEMENREGEIRMIRWQLWAVVVVILAMGIGVGLTFILAAKSWIGAGLAALAVCVGLTAYPLGREIYLKPLLDGAALLKRTGDAVVFADGTRVQAADVTGVFVCLNRTRVHAQEITLELSGGGEGYKHVVRMGEGLNQGKVHELGEDLGRRLGVPVFFGKM